MITIFETYLDHNYLSGYDKYILLRFRVADDIYYMIVESVLNSFGAEQFKKLYETYIDDDRMRKIESDLYFTLTYEKFLKQFISQSNDLEYLLDKYDEIIQVKKFNL